MKLSKEYEKEFKKTFDAYIKEIKTSNLKDKKYCLFYPMIGKDYSKSKEILIIGRAVNNWGGLSWSGNSRKKDVIKKAIEFSEENKGECPIDWVNKYWDDKGSNVRYSGFWQVIYKLIEKHYHRNDEDWSHVMAWSNLYKISPATGGNPNKTLEWKYQLDNDKKLLKREVSELSPKNILMMTGLSWAEDFVSLDKKVNNKYVKATAKIKNSNVIITIRPEGEKQQPFIDSVIKYLK